jgi:hypothetical protein
MGPIFEQFGAVRASPRAAYRLLKQGNSVLLFPGGGREVLLRSCSITLCPGSLVVHTGIAVHRPSHCFAHAFMTSV